MKTLIIGAGEVGKALKEIVSPFHETHIRDLEPLECKGVEVLHICYPDSVRFNMVTREYIEEYKPLITVINSSVFVGTTKGIGNKVVYSPIRGRHPQNGLAHEMKFYPKFIASLNNESLKIADEYFQLCGLDVYISNSPDSLEYLKLMSNVHMGLEIAWRQEIERMMKVFKIEGKDYSAWEESYLNGYLKLGQYNLIRPIMSPEPIGGHCILPCTEILRSQFPSKAMDFIIESNQKALTSKAK